MTREQIIAALERLRDNPPPYRRTEHPPIHPADYAAAKAWRSGDEPLTITDYWNWRARDV